MARQIGDTEFVPKSLRNRPAAIAACILFGYEVGLEPMQSLAKIAVIDGKPALTAEAQRALILAAGHEVWIEDATATRVTIAGRRRDSEQVTRVTWTMDDARRANLAGRQNWRTYPRQMLLARASAELARAIFADAIGGLMAAEELEDGDVPQDGDTAPPKQRRRRRAATTTAAAPAPLDEAAQATPPSESDAPPPPPEDESPPSSPSPGDVESEQGGFTEPLASEPQRRKMFALFRERLVLGRDERLAYARQVIGRDVASSTELTISEAAKIIDALEEPPPGDPEDSFPDSLGDDVA
jgi:hypothetical protein